MKRPRLPEEQERQMRQLRGFMAPLVLSACIALMAAGCGTAASSSGAAQSRAPAALHRHAHLDTTAETHENAGAAA